MNLISTIVLMVLLLVAMAAIVSLPVMWLWDWLMPELFGLKEITWPQAFGLLLLCGFLFKNSSTESKS